MMHTSLFSLVTGSSIKGSYKSSEMNTVGMVLLLTLFQGRTSAGNVPPVSLGYPEVMLEPYNVQFLGSGVQKRHAVKECTDGYEKVANSTMCLVDSNKVRRSGTSEKDKQLILDEHNRYRASVNPTACNMRKMYWDDELARVAQKWSRQCRTGHDLVRFMPKYGTSAGQNAGYGYKNWKQVIKAWHDEVELYKYGKLPETYLGPDGWGKIGHYTQVVKDTTMLIGCGFSKCRGGYRRYFFCNYLPGQGSFHEPYRAGKPCSECPGSCNSQGLCDCPNHFCFHRGVVDINTCKCTCKPPWFGPKCLDHPCDGKMCQHGGTLNTGTCQCACAYPYTGDECEILSCEVRTDPSHCGQTWKPEQCNVGTVAGSCPVMCAICPAPCDGKSCENYGTLNVERCSCTCQPLYKGERCEKLDCDSFVSPSVCSTYPESYCVKYYNIPSKCPVLCGLCKAPCDGKRCQNGGTLIRATCSCSCGTHFTGDECQNVNCEGVKDLPFCGIPGGLPESHCQMYKNSADLCPIMCGRCKAAVCDGKECQNGGTLDSKSCTCSCTSQYRGNTCEHKKCPDKMDPPYCGTIWPQSYCIFKNVPPACPIMCGQCPKHCTGKVCENGGVLDVKSCSCTCTKLYKGDRCSQLDCPKSDHSVCGSVWPKSFCKKYANVPFDCPYMCGKCR